MCYIYMDSGILGRRRGSPGYLSTVVNTPTRAANVCTGTESHMCKKNDINWCFTSENSPGYPKYLGVITERKEISFVYIIILIMREKT